MKQKLRDAEDHDLSEIEKANVKEFYLEEIEGQSLAKVTQVFSLMFRDVKDQLLKGYFINSITKNKMQD